MLIKVKEITGSNYETLTRLWNENLELYKSLIDDKQHLTKFSNFVLSKLKIKFETIKEFESLFDLETSLAILNDHIVNVMMQLLNESFVESLMLNKKWVDFDAIGASINSGTQTGDNVMSYSGYSVINQEGQYNKTKTNNTASSTSSGGMQRLQYLSFLQTVVNDKCNVFISSIKKNMLKLIY